MLYGFYLNSNLKVTHLDIWAQALVQISSDLSFCLTFPKFLFLLITVFKR